MELGPLVNFTLDPDASIQHLAETLTDGQSQACAAVLSRSRYVGLHELFEQQIYSIFWYANARVFNDKVIIEFPGQMLNFFCRVFGTVV